LPSPLPTTTTTTTYTVLRRTFLMAARRHCWRPLTHTPSRPHAHTPAFGAQQLLAAEAARQGKNKLDEDYLAGIDIVFKCLAAPMMQIAENAGVDGEVCSWPTQLFDSTCIASLARLSFVHSNAQRAGGAMNMPEGTGRPDRPRVLHAPPRMYPLLPP
jgi:hypothetical protein